MEIPDYACMNVFSPAPTGAPEGLISTTEGKSTSQILVWGTVNCTHQRGPITGYRLRYSNGTSIVNTTNEESRQHVLTGLTPFTNYSVQVAAVNDGGTGPYSTPLTVETLQDGECIVYATHKILLKYLVICLCFCTSLYLC